MPVIRGLNFPDHLCYLAEQHTWARREADGSVTVGITALGGALAREYVAFMPKPTGASVEQNRGLGVIEMAKTVASVRAPVAGAIIAANEAAIADPALINRDPYDRGWLIKLAPSNWNADCELLVTGEKIRDAIENIMRLENFENVRQPGDIGAEGT